MRYGDQEKMGFGTFPLWEGFVVLKGLILHFVTFEECGVLDLNSLVHYYFERV